MDGAESPKLLYIELNGIKNEIDCGCLDPNTYC